MSITSAAQWWRSAVIYQIYPKSWADGDGDGYGDIAGIRSRLPYLARLGVDAIWLSPWYPSPQADGGYDVSDHRAVDPRFGSVEQAEALIEEAHDLGIKIILDIVPNHLATEHPLFQAAAASAPGSPEWGRFHCVRGVGQTPPNDWDSAFGGSAWEPVRDAAGEPTGWWYLHLFDVSQADLNWEHPDIHAEFEQTLRFWFDRGVDGFRIDVATGLVKAAGYPSVDEWRATHPETGRYASPYWDHPGVHDIWRSWRRISDAYQPPRAFVGEVWVETAAARARYARADELHTAFDFGYLIAPWDARRLREAVDDSLRELHKVGAQGTWALDNHDVVRSRTRFGLQAAGNNAERHQRPDVAPEDSLGERRGRAALLFMLGLPGSAYLYQGQELGLPEVLDLADELREDPAFRRTGGTEGFRDGCRIPIPWTEQGESFGFSASGASWLPQPRDWGALSVAAQESDPDSTLSLVRRALHLRRSQAPLGDGDMTWRCAPGDGLLLLRRPDDSVTSDYHVLVAMNMGTEPALVAADEVLICSGTTPRGVEGGFLLEPDTAAWFK